MREDRVAAVYAPGGLAPGCQSRHTYKSLRDALALMTWQARMDHFRTADWTNALNQLANGVDVWPGRAGCSLRSVLNRLADFQF